MSDDNLIQIQELIDSAMSSLKTANGLMRDITGVSDSSHERIMSQAQDLETNATSGKIVEGVFDGQNMVDSGGQTYPVPANYASKSKLVESDGMKLTITDEGKFIYKQISPIPRKTLVGLLIQEDGQYKVLAEGKPYRVLLASVTFYRAEVGDQVTILLPEGQEATWGAIDAVLPKHIADEAATSTAVSTPTENEDGELSPAMEESTE